MGEHRGSICTKQALAGEQRCEPLVSERSRVGPGSGNLYIYISCNTTDRKSKK
jgi:hypothetical protein